MKPKQKAVSIATFALIMLLVPMHGFAQSGADQWKFSLTPYLWLPSAEASLRYGPPPASGASPNVSVDAEDILSSLDFAFMLTGDARKGRWSVAADFIYLALSNDKSNIKSVDFNAGPGPVNVTNTTLNLGTNVDLKGTVWTVMGGYSIVDEPNARVDLIGGFRYLDLEATTNWMLSATVTGPAGAASFARTGRGRVQGLTVAEVTGRNVGLSATARY